MDAHAFRSISQTGGTEMKSKRSWKWLAPQITSRRVRNADATMRANGRPCLAVERLEDRNLLTAANSEIVVEPPPLGDDAAVVVGLLEGGVKVTTDEFQLLKFLSTATPAEPKVNMQEIVIKKDLDKASPMLLQLNDTLVKVGEDIINGELTDQKLMAAEAKIEYLKIKLEDIIISSLAAEDQETGTAMVNSLIGDAGNLVSALITHRKAGKGQQEYIQLSADILKMEDVAMRGELDIIKAQSPGLSVDDFTVKIEQLYQKASEEIADLNLNQDTTQKLQTALDDFNTSLLGNLSGGGNFDGGITTPSTDDTIS
jgi:Type VI secretion system effector, Hcp